MEWLARILLPVFVGFMFLSYFFVASAEHRAIVEIFTLHNILVIISALLLLVYSFVLLKKPKTSVTKDLPEVLYEQTGAV